MNKRILFSIALLATAIGIFAVLPLKGHIPVLMYHYVPDRPTHELTSLDVTAHSFERQMWFLKTFGYRVISVSDFAMIKRKEMAPRGREVLITFDDGNETYLEEALPILEKYGLPSINFLIYDNVVGEKSGSMTVDEVRSIMKKPLVTLGSHTITHPVLPNLSMVELHEEVLGAKTKLEAMFEMPFPYFCYPTGAFNSQVAEEARLAGYQLAFTTGRKQLKGASETLYSVVRHKVGPKDNLLTFWFKVSGIKEVYFSYKEKIDRFLH